jgi:TRAP-type mannitol/chloroaromatic compound transport system substrate-binding protein
MERRHFLTAAAAAAAAAPLASPHVARAQDSFTWQMTNAYGPGAPFYVEGPGSPTDFCAKVEAMSGGRLRIQHFAAGELIPALEGFDAVRSGAVQMNAANAYFWAGKAPAAQFFTCVPFGLNFQGQAAWMMHGGGQALYDEVYEPLGMKALVMGNTGVQMTGWFREPIETVGQFNGLKMRIPGLAGKVYASLGVDVRLLPGGEIFPALERGVIDAAEFVGPYQDRRLGLQNAARFYHTTGWHEPSNMTELLINKAAWDSLPADLQAIVQAAAYACLIESHAWCEAVNAEAMTDLVTNHGVTAAVLPPEVVAALKEATRQTLSDLAASDPAIAKVYEAFTAFKAQHDVWAGLSEKPYHAMAAG